MTPRGALVHFTGKCSCNVSRICVFVSFFFFRLNGRKRSENATCGRKFFENGEKKLRFQTTTDTC